MAEVSLELTATVNPPPSSPHRAMSLHSSPLTLAFSRSTISLLHQATHGCHHCRADRARLCITTVFLSRNASVSANLISSFLVSRCPRSTNFHAASSPRVPGHRSHGHSSRWPLWPGHHEKALAALSSPRMRADSPVLPRRVPVADVPPVFQKNVTPTRPLLEFASRASYSNTTKGRVLCAKPLTYMNSAIMTFLFCFDRKFENTW
jgi:hypothetical protein